MLKRSVLKIWFLIVFFSLNGLLLSAQVVSGDTDPGCSPDCGLSLPCNTVTCPCNCAGCALDPICPIDGNILLLVALGIIFTYRRISLEKKREIIAN